MMQANMAYNRSKTLAIFCQALFARLLRQVGGQEVLVYVWQRYTNRLDGHTRVGVRAICELPLQAEVKRCAEEAVAARHLA